MGEEIAISLKNVSKCFKRYSRPVDRLKEVLLPGKSRTDEFWALRDINIEIPKGQTVGVIGRNGSGKSTLLQIIVGTLTPSTGDVRVDGRVSALLELGSGFNPEFTGRQNVFFNGRLLGLSQKQIEDRFDDIAAFADIGDFIEQPVKTYSSGMYVRLAFAVAVNVDPEILIVDEALAVGDIVFQHRCMRQMRAMMDSGVTTLFVSHDAGAIKTLCNSAIMIHDGKVHTTGLPNAVVIEYLKLVTELELGLAQEVEVNSQKQVNTVVNKETQASNPQNSDISSLSSSFSKATRRGSGKARIESVKILNHLGEYAGENPILAFDEQVTLIVNLKVYFSLKSCIVGFYICDKNGNEVIGSNTLEENIKIGELEPGEEIEIKFKFNLPLRPSSYSLTVAGSESYEALSFDWIDNIMVFQILPPETGKHIHALVAQPMVVEVNKEVLPRIATQV
ncbi:ABC transporter ATP-binding protein [Nostoc linckia z18]|uniref:ABC transporter ATP-binding protein n=2 Tax=Nostoc linckia TaxID=92942 RepID=A0A9Q5ZD41_NOSLI|nr:ABC transporter ATP-binding protein [Nostoc linckia]PHK41080.1 ABC transporter ATP-binding protein [Nostoc linckia z15]PHK45399.1 ABC transporter ATP-binding protein [Nostoc linckia z16]PHJ60086.1 ABC transporter ATP-binding protein [Nostoc linckia z1]PHJ63359.1 ABC transporter ATP-binding protein [Nostoc linckia z3]PHJ70576.1 ABC transporter ATP-binding protein [Nostoc linckia z2]